MLRCAWPEMLVGEQELHGRHALVCGVELHGLPSSWPILDDCVDPRSRHPPTPSSPVDPEECSNLIPPSSLELDGDSMLVIDTPCAPRPRPDVCYFVSLTVIGLFLTRTAIERSRW